MPPTPPCSGLNSQKLSRNIAKMEIPYPPLFETIIQKLEAGNAYDAISTLLDAYDLQDHEDLVRCYTFYCRVRHHFSSRSEYVHPEYSEKLTSLMDFVEDEDRELLELLLDAKPLQRSQIYKSHYPYLSDPHADNLLKSISPYIDVINDFRFPAELVERVRIYKNFQAESREMAPSLMAFTPRDTQRIFSIAEEKLNNLHQPPVRPKDLTTAIVLMQVVTGRRFNEIASTLTVSPVEYKPFQAMVTGLLKRSGPVEVPITIPILVPFETVYRVLHLIRGVTRGERVSGSHVSRTSEELFGIPISHTVLRNVYLSLAYEMRHVSGFLPNASRAFFDVKALGHVANSTLPYQRLDV